jgi:hypothetical protein
LTQQQNDPTFVPPPPPSFQPGKSFHPPYLLEQKRREAESDAKTALILTVVGFVACGIILGLIALPKANNALEIIKIYEVAEDSRSMAMAAKVLAIIEVFGWAALLLLQIIAAMLSN